VLRAGARAGKRSDTGRRQDAIARVKDSFLGARRVVVLGCTGGAGQTLTSLVLGHVFACHRVERCIALDANPGDHSLARRIPMETPETLTSLLARLGTIGGYLGMRAYTSQSRSRLEVLASDDPTIVSALNGRDYATALAFLDRYYKLTLIDPATAVVARLLPLADQLVLVTPASPHAGRAAAMTLDWLEGHGYTRLTGGAVMVVGGVSRRTAADAAEAEASVAGRCGGVVHIPWDDHLSSDPATEIRLEALGEQTQLAYLTLASVVAAGFSAVPSRYHQEVSR
ncbi:MAG: MinD/ParA family ATP-binding protein, partial [Streptosporangiaceae bacterium]